MDSDRETWNRDRLQAAAHALGGGAALGRKLGHTTGGQVGHMLKGRRPITQKTIDKIEELPGFHGWFDRNRDTPPARVKPISAVNNKAAASNDALYIPLLENTGSMGRGSNILDADVVVGELPLGRLWVSEFLRPSSTEKLRFMHAIDQSMIPTLSSGDVVLVDCGQREPGYPDGIYVLGDAEHIYIKRVRRTLAGTLEVSSDNPAVKTAEALDGRKEIRVLGRAIWVWNGERL